MASGARAATKSTEGGPIVSLIVGIILIVVGLGIETERFRATAVITGGLLALYGGLQVIGFLIEGDDDVASAKKWVILFSIVATSALLVLIFGTDDTIVGIAGLVLIGSIILNIGAILVLRDEIKAQEEREIMDDLRRRGKI